MLVAWTSCGDREPEPPAAFPPAVPTVLAQAPSGPVVASTPLDRPTHRDARRDLAAQVRQDVVAELIRRQGGFEGRDDGRLVADLLARTGDPDLPAYLARTGRDEARLLQDLRVEAWVAEQARPQPVTDADVEAFVANHPELFARPPQVLVTTRTWALRETTPEAYALVERSARDGVGLASPPRREWIAPGRLDPAIRAWVRTAAPGDRTILRTPDGVTEVTLHERRPAWRMPAGEARARARASLERRSWTHARQEVLDDLRRGVDETFFRDLLAEEVRP